MSKRFVIANDQIYDMYNINNTNLHVKDGCLYRLDKCIGVVYDELDITELKAKAFDVIMKKRVDTYSLEFCDKLVQYNMYVKVYNESVWKGNERHFLEEEEYNIIKQALEVE